KREKWTLVELGSRLGVHNTYISQLEKGRRIPNADMIIKVADLFNVTCDELMRDEIAIAKEKCE
ncbi:MAG: helix-turn-helix transcriptional regulator, partial [Chloroflexota bacterium]